MKLAAVAFVSAPLVEAPSGVAHVLEVLALGVPSLDGP